MQAECEENDCLWWRHLAKTALKDIEENQWFGNGNRIPSGNFIATTLKLAEKFDHSFLHLFIFDDIFARGRGFAAMAVESHSFRLISTPFTN